MDQEQHEQGVVVIGEEEGTIVVSCGCGWVSEPHHSGQAAGAAFDEHRLTTSV